MDTAALKELVMSTFVLCSKCNYFKSGARKVSYRGGEVQMRIWPGAADPYGRKMY